MKLDPYVCGGAEFAFFFPLHFAKTLGTSIHRVTKPKAYARNRAAWLLGS